MKPANRRQFLFRSGMTLGLATSSLSFDALMNASARAAADPEAEAKPSAPGKDPTALYNNDLRTAIGLGDEPAGIVDKFGQLIRSRNAAARVELGSPLQPAEKAAWSQSLLDGYLPIVETQLKTGNASLHWSTFASSYGDVKADYIEIKDAKTPHRIELLFPYTTTLQVKDGAVTSGGQLLAIFPPPQKSSVTLAKYNLLTPEAYSSERPAWEERTEAKLPPNMDAAFGSSRNAFLNRWIEYRFPVQAGKAYYVYLGVLPEKRKPGEIVLKLSVNEQSQRVDYGVATPGEPAMREFKVTPTAGELRVKSSCDPSATDPYRNSDLSGIWIFEAPVNAAEVAKGALSKKALFYVQCGKEPVHDMASSVILDYAPTQKEESRWIRLPYDAAPSDSPRVVGIAPESARAEEKARWEALFRKGAEFVTGVPHLDNLYKTSLINLFLLRTEFPGRGKDGQDIYVVKPGPDLYDDFWTRDGSYIAVTFDLAGLSEEAEKSLRLFWQPHLTGTLATWGQQPTGEWAAPITEWDAQGQALWALVSHYEFTGDKTWLRSIYESIVNGARWMKAATEQTQYVNEDGEKPIYYGLLPPGEGEAIAYGYNYYHCFWGVLGLRQALRAAQALNQTDDAAWIKKLYEEYASNLLASVKLACQRVGNNKFIPATPFDPKAPIWGSMTALYPARFLDPHDPMMTGTLEILDGQAQEDTYLYEHNHLWTYITVEGAMCHLLRDELPEFYRFYNGYVAHASPTNAWVEGILLKHRRGTGDMPHGWAAAEYVTIHRNSLVYENEQKLELGWGLQPNWLHDGAKLAARRAPTKFGMLELTLERSGPELALDYSLSSSPEHKAPEAIYLHIPKVKEAITSVRINSKTRSISPGERTIKLG